MTTSIWLRDVLAYGLQLAVIVGAGAALALAFRIREPKVMLAYWRTLLVACLLLPLCQPWLRPTRRSRRRRWSRCLSRMS